MNPFYKVALGLFAIVLLLNASCKKNSAAPGKKDNTAALSKQLAMGLYNSLSNGVSTSAHNGLKTGSTRTLITMDAPSCGQSVTTLTNRTETSGDTTRLYLGNSIFTYMCDGFYHNNKDLDAYILRDTSATIETGTGFKNNYKTTLYYVVKSTDANYNTLSVVGATNTYWYNSKVNGSVVIESHAISTDYTWSNVVADRSGVRTVFTAGTVNYAMHIVDTDSTTGANGQVYDYTGVMTFLPNSKMTVTMSFGGTTKTYLVNLLTGESIEQ